MIAESARSTGQGAAFSGRVLTYLIAQVVTAGLLLLNGVVLARILGPSQKGDYYLLILLPTTLMVLGQLGLSQAFGFFSARGLTHGIVLRTTVVTGAISIPALLLALVLVPILNANLFHGIEPVLIVFSLLTLPLLLNATFTTGILVGRQSSRWVSILKVGPSLIAMPLIVLTVGILGLGLWGAILTFGFLAATQATLALVGASRLVGLERPAGSVGYRDLFRYGLPLYPASVTQFFSYRADVFLLALLVVDPSAQLGWYSMAVGVAELVFFLPHAAATFFFPHVVAATRDDSDRHVPVVSRVSLILTSTAAVALVPIAYLGIHLILPAFKPSLPALYVLLPGVVAFSVTKVLSSYVLGLGQRRTVSVVALLSFTGNIALNFALIPQYGMVGAAAASTVSYTVSSIVYSLIVGRLARVSAPAFWMPRRSDLRYLWTTASSVTGSLARILLESIPRQRS